MRHARRIAIVPADAASPKGRGTTWALEHRFSSQHAEPWDDGWGTLDQQALEVEEPPETRIIEERVKSILTSNDSPDIAFDLSINPYRGCEYGCKYCYARYTHEFMEFRESLDFERRIFAKRIDIAGQMGARIDIPVTVNVTRRAGNAAVDLGFNPARTYEKMLAAYVAKGHTAAEYLRETQAFDKEVTISLVAWCRGNSILSGKTYPALVERKVPVTILYNGDPAIIDGPQPRATASTREANGGPPVK